MLHAYVVRPIVRHLRYKIRFLLYFGFGAAFGVIATLTYQLSGEIDLRQLQKFASFLLY